MARLLPCFPRSRGKPPVDERRVVSGIIDVIRNCLMWKDAPRGDGPHKTFCNRFLRWSRAGAFEQISAAIAREAGIPEQLMIDSTYLKAHRTAASPAERMARPACKAVSST